MALQLADIKPNDVWTHSGKRRCVRRVLAVLNGKIVYSSGGSKTYICGLKQMRRWISSGAVKDWSAREN